MSLSLSLGRREFARASAVGIAMLSVGAWASDPKVDVQADVVLAQEKGTTIDPPELSKMQQALAAKRRYGSLKRISSTKLSLTSKPTALTLPSGKGEVSLVGVKDGVATVKLKVSQVESTLKLGAQGSLYQQAGVGQGGELWVVLSRPR